MVIHAPYEWLSSSLSPSNKKKKKALEFCKEFFFPCPQDVRTWSLHDTGYCFNAIWSINLWDTSNINLWAPEKNWIVKTAFLAIQQQATATTVKILYRILTLFPDFRDFLASLINKQGEWDQIRSMREVITEKVALVINDPFSWCLDPSSWCSDPSGQPSDPLSGP